MEEIKEEDNGNDSVEISLSNVTDSQGSVDFESSFQEKESKQNNKNYYQKKNENIKPNQKLFRKPLYTEKDFDELKIKRRSAFN